MKKLDFDSTYSLIEKYYYKYFSLSNSDNNEETKYELEILFDHFLNDFIEIVADCYVESIKQENNFLEKYKEELFKSVSVRNILLIDILINTSFFPSLTLSKQEAVHILTNLIDFNKKIGEEEIFKIGHFFEQFLEFLELMPNVQEDVKKLLTKMLTLNMPESYYEAFHSSFNKLLYFLPKHSKESFLVAKKGLSIPFPGLNWDFKNFIKKNYIEKGLADENYNWIGANS